jgi:sporulation protein YlmC with PRC-barrel domain
MPTASGHTTAIKASRVIGTKVYNAQGEHLGEVKDIILDKTGNSIMFAAVGFGGVLGMGEKYHPLPWAMLDYDKEKDGFIVNATKEQLKAAPADSLDELTENDGAIARDACFDYYGAQRYW